MSYLMNRELRSFLLYDYLNYHDFRNVGFDESRTGIRASVQRKIETGEGFVEVRLINLLYYSFLKISQTETVYNENNVVFRHRCLLPYRFGRESRYQIVV